MIFNLRNSIILFSLTTIILMGSLKPLFFLVRFFVISTFLFVPDFASNGVEPTTSDGVTGIFEPDVLGFTFLNKVGSEPGFGLFA